MKLISLFLLLGISLNSFTQDLDKEENKYLGYIYQQKKYQLDDSQGDILLIWSAYQIPKFIFKTLTGDEKELLQQNNEKIENLLLLYPEYRPQEETKNLIVDDYVTINPEHIAIELEGQKAPFKVKNISLMMKQVIAEEYQVNGLSPQLGNPHTWSPSIVKELKKEFKIFSRMSKLLLALARGVTSSYLVTGTEEQLKDYILSRSINLEEMFRASYRINQGDVYLSLLTIENVLSRFWPTPDRSKRAITTKLKDITNYNYYTDKYGAWYHLFGIMLFGYVEGGFKAKLVGGIETMGSLIMGRFQDEKQERYINSRGGPIGSRLRPFIENKEYEKFELNKKYLEEDFYMDLNENFSKRLKKRRD